VDADGDLEGMGIGMGIGMGMVRVTRRFKTQKYRTHTGMRHNDQRDERDKGKGK